MSDIEAWEEEAERLIRKIRTHVRNIEAAKQRGDQGEVERHRRYARADTQRLISHIKKAPRGARIPEVPREK